MLSSQLVKKAFQNLQRLRKNHSNPFSAGACTWRKILLRLQVWNLFAIGEQILRAAACKNLSESPEGDFRQSEARRVLPAGFPFSV